MNDSNNLGAIIFASLAIGIGFGTLIGIAIGENATKKQAIEVGVAKYNEKTAKFEWILPENNN